MTSKEWQKIAAARQLLRLKEKASLEEIRRAYRQLAREHHPDVAADPETAGHRMHELTEAYRTLLDYGSRFQFPLVPGAGDASAAEDWWMSRFGGDPIWGKGDRREEE